MNGLYEDVKAILKYSQEYPFEPNIDSLMDKWRTAKSSFIKKFGGVACVRSKEPIRIESSEEQRSRRFSEFMSALDESNLLTAELENFLIGNKQSFFNNLVTKPYPSLNIKDGMKLSKSLKYFINDPTSVRWAQDVASTFMQEDKIEGYLYLSVDPRDFLTLSENKHNWTSCHSLDDSYRAGNLSYMVDETTLIAYIATEKLERLKCMPRDMRWNNKKWRMLVHVGKNCIYYNKQYPFSSDELLNSTYNFLMQYISHNSIIKSTGFEIPSDVYAFRQVKMGDDIVELPTNYLTNEFRIFAACDVIDSRDYAGYCDLISSSTYTPIVSLRRSASEEYINQCSHNNFTVEQEVVEFRKLFGIKIGEKVPCVRCGCGKLHKKDSFLCLNCIAELDADEDFFLKCDCCNHRLDPDFDKIVFHNKIAYCKSCYNALKRDGVIKEEDEEDG